MSVVGRIDAIYGTPVHVYRGRRCHIALNYGRTLCGQHWVWQIVGRPATEMPPCKRCDREMGLS